MGSYSSALELVLDPEVLLAPVVAVVAITALGLALLGFARGYKAYFRQRLLNVTRLADARSLRRKLEVSLQAAPAGGVGRQLAREVDRLIEAIYELDRGEDSTRDSELQARRANALRLVGEARFPMLLVSSGEAMELEGARTVPPGRLLELLLQRELRLAYNVSLALGALSAGERERPFRSTRLLLAGNRRITKQVFGAMARSSDSATQEVGREHIRLLRGAAGR